MSRIKIFIILFIFYAITLNAQTTIYEPSQSASAKYRLFRTTNMWTFLKLETTTGKIWILQYDVNGDDLGGQLFRVRCQAGQVVVEEEPLKGARGKRLLLLVAEQRLVHSGNI